MRRAGLAGRGEQLQLPGPVLADQVDHRPPGVAEPRARLGVGQPVDEVGAQRLVPPLVHLLRGGEPLRPGMLRRSGCHTVILADTVSVLAVAAARPYHARICMLVMICPTLDPANRASRCALQG